MLKSRAPHAVESSHIIAVQEVTADTKASYQPHAAMPTAATLRPAKDQNCLQVDQTCHRLKLFSGVCYCTAKQHPKVASSALGIARQIAP